MGGMAAPRSAARTGIASTRTQALAAVDAAPRAGWRGPRRGAGSRRHGPNVLPSAAAARLARDRAAAAEESAHLRAARRRRGRARARRLHRRGVHRRRAAGELVRSAAGRSGSAEQQSRACRNCCASARRCCATAPRSKWTPRSSCPATSWRSRAGSAFRPTCGCWTSTASRPRRRCSPASRCRCRSPRRGAATPGDGRSATARNMLFAGSTVARGRGRGVVVATGADTVIGGLAVTMSATAERQAAAHRAHGALQPRDRRGRARRPPCVIGASRRAGERPGHRRRCSCSAWRSRCPRSRRDCRWR